MGSYLSSFSAAEFGIGAVGILLTDFLVVLVCLICGYTDAKSSRIPNIVTFPAWLAGFALNFAFGGVRGLLWSLLGWLVGMAIQWIPYQLRFAKAGDVKLLAAMGALKGWAFCSFGFLYGAAAYFFILVPWLWKRGELQPAVENITRYFHLGAITQTVPDAPAPTTERKYMPWAVGLVVGFLVALFMERFTGRAIWIR
jgi:prepilin peptidase CpaA